jgi:hypothetical protein
MKTLHLQQLLNRISQLETLTKNNRIIKEINPEEPFYKDYTNSYCFHVEKEVKKQHEDFYQSIDTPLSEKEYQIEFSKYINQENFLSNGKDIVLKKIWEDCFFVYQKLEKLKTLGLNYTLDLTGGAVRDFILNQEKEIKDLDFMISIYHEKSVVTLDKEKIQKLLPKENPEELMYDSQLLYNKLIESCFKENIKQSFLNLEKNDLPDYYQSPAIEQERETLHGVIKLKKQNYNIDLLLTEKHKVKFLSSFDFNICKTSFSLIGYHHQTFPQKYHHLISRFSADVSFFADTKNKKLTMYLDNFSEKEIIRSLTHHYQRLQKKYPTYQTHFAILSKYPNKELLQKKNIAENIIYHDYLKNHIAQTSTIKNRNKI